MTHAQAERFKEEGNDAYRAGRLRPALEKYTQAINVDGSVPAYYTNRARVHYALHEYEGARADCDSALALDGKSVKGHFLRGQALFELREYESATESFKKAMRFGIESSADFTDQIATWLKKARKERWQSIERDRMNRRPRVLAHLETLINENASREMDRLKPGDDAKRRDIVNLSNECLSEMHALYAAHAQFQPEKREIPEYLCCKITYEVMAHPVTTPSGITYERSAILEHINKVGAFDPVTRAPLTPEQLINNLALREAIESYLDQNPWCNDY